MAKTNGTYGSAGIPLAGRLYTPDDSHAGPRPAIVVGHPGSGVKEQARARGGQYGLEGFEYYISGPTAHPRSAKFLTWSSIDHMAFFDAFSLVNLIGQRPLLMIVGNRAVTSRSGIIREHMGFREWFGHHRPLNTPVSPNAPR